MLGVSEPRTEGLVVAALAVRDAPRGGRSRRLREGVTASEHDEGRHERHGEECSTHEGDPFETDIAGHGGDAWDETG